MENELARLLLIHGESINRYFKIFTRDEVIYDQHLECQEEWNGRKVTQDFEFQIPKEEYDAIIAIYGFANEFYPNIKSKMFVVTNNGYSCTVRVQKEIIK